MSDFLVAMGLVLIIEGVLYGGFPHFAKRLVHQILLLDETALRKIGIASVAAGLFLVWIVRG